MINLLIDTCTLLNMRDGDNDYLSILEEYIISEKIQLFTHQHIVDEWEKHKNKRRKKIEGKLLYERSRAGANELSTELLPSNSISYLDNKTDQIDRILALALRPPTPEAIKYEASNSHFGLIYSNWT